jgi:hypothetical protein
MINFIIWQDNLAPLKERNLILIDLNPKNRRKIENMGEVELVRDTTFQKGEQKFVFPTFWFFTGSPRSSSWYWYV